MKNLYLSVLSYKQIEKQHESRRIIWGWWAPLTILLDAHRRPQSVFPTNGRSCGAWTEKLLVCSGSTEQWESQSCGSMKRWEHGLLGALSSVSIDCGLLGRQQLEQWVETIQSVVTRDRSESARETPLVGSSRLQPLLAPPSCGGSSASCNPSAHSLLATHSK